MKVSCPSCSATLNIDDKKIPAGGARIKCPTCAHVFPVKPGTGSSSSAVALPGAAAPASSPSAPSHSSSTGSSSSAVSASTSGAVPLPGMAAPTVKAPAPAPARQAWEDAPTRAVPVSGIPGALTAAAPPSNVAAQGLGGRTATMPALTNHEVNSAKHVPLPGAAAPSASVQTSEEPTHGGPSPGQGVPPQASASDFDFDFTNTAPAPTSGSVPLPGASSPPPLRTRSEPAISSDDSFDLPPLDSGEPDAAGFASPSGSVPLPGGSRASASSGSGVGVPLPGASTRQRAPEPAAYAPQPDSDSVPLPGASSGSSSGARSSGSGVVPLPGRVPIPEPEPETYVGSGPSSHDPNAVPLPGNFDPSASAGAFDFPAAPAASSASGFDFSEAPPPSQQAAQGFDFSEIPAAPESTSGGFDFPEAPPPQAATSAGFDFVEAPPASSGSGFDFAEPPPPPDMTNTGMAPAPTVDDLAFDFNAPPPAAAPSFGEVDFGGPPAPAADGLEFDPMAAPAPRGDDLEADLNAPLPQAPAASGPADGLEMLSFIDDTAKDAGAPAEGAGAPSRRFHIKRRSGKVFGPFEEAVIVKMMEDGQLLGNEEVSVDTENWQPIGAEPAFQAVIARLMEAPARPDAAAAAPQVHEAPKGPSMERLKQLYEGRMAAVAVVQGKEPVPFKKRVPYIVAGAAIVAFIGIGIFGGVGTPYGYFFLKKLFPARVKPDTREFGYLQAARKGFITDTYASYKFAKEQTVLALNINQYPEAKAVWAQSVYYLKRKYNIGEPPELTQAENALADLILLGEKHPETLKAYASHELTKKNPTAAIGYIDDALARQDDAELHFLRAEALLQQKQLGQAKAEFEQVLKTDAKSPRALHALGLVAETQKDVPAAVKRFEEAFAAEPLHASSAVELAELALVAKDREQGKAWLEKALTPESRKQLAPGELGKALGLKAELLVLENKINEAVPEFEEALKADPTNAFAKAGLGATYLQLHQPDKAAPLFAAANIAVPDKLEYAEGYLTSLIALGKMDEAVKVVKATNQLFPGNAMLAYLSGRVSDALDKPKDAEEAYKRAIAADPNIADAYLYLARLFMRFRRFNESRPILEAGLEKDADNAALRVGMGELAFYSRDIERAETEFRRASEINSNLSEAFLGLSRVALEKDKLDLASTHVDKALELNPRVAGGRLQKGIVLWKLGRLEEAIKELTQARDDEPRNVQIVVTLGAVEFEKGDMADALGHLSSAIQAETVPSDAYFYFARVKNAKLEHTQAIENMKRALDYDPKNPKYHYWMGRVMADAKKMEDAIAEWNLALELDPKYADALESMGRIYFDRNQLTKAIDFFNRVLVSDPSRTVVRALIGDAYMKVEDWGSAIATYTRAIEADPENKELLYVYFRVGQAHQEKGNIKEAINWYKKALDVEPGNADAYRTIGYLYKDSKKWKLAIEAFEKYLEIKPNAEDKKQIDDEIWDLKKEK